MAQTALITGASSGLGAEYARQLAADGTHLVLVARDAAALQSIATQLSEQHGITAETLATDLLHSDDLARVTDRLSDPARPIDMLINNAGFGLSLAFDENSLDDEVRHQRLHNEIPLRLMHTALQGMLARKSGTIINVSSVAAFLPRSTYAASKRWLVSFSNWANAKYRARGVRVSAVCPGFTHTNFHERLGLPPGEEGIPNWMWLEAPNVVAASLRDARRGKALSIPSLRYKLLAAVARAVPAGLLARAGERGRASTLADEPHERSTQ